jgi:hypothetical protein
MSDVVIDVERAGPFVAERHRAASGFPHAIYHYQFHRSSQHRDRPSADRSPKRLLQLTCSCLSSSHKGFMQADRAGLELAQFDGSDERDTAANQRTAASLPPPSHHPHPPTHACPPDRSSPDATSGTSPNHENEELTSSMSRSPLILRSSPALGTGSFGASYGVLSLQYDQTDSDEQDETQPRRFLPRKAGKGKSALRRTLSVEGGSHDDSGGYEEYAAQAGFGASRKRRKSTPGGRRQSHDYETLWASLEGEDGGIGTRFTGSALPGFAAAPLDGITSNVASQSDEDEDGSLFDNEDASIKSPNSAPPADDSPYAQVRASVSPYDNTTLSINTPRMWLLSTIFSIFGSATNLFFSLRYPSVSITPVIALLIVHPVGLLWDKTLKRSDDPKETFVNGSLESTTSSESGDALHTSSCTEPRSSWRRQLRLWLAQGRWNEKEHSCVFISSNVSFGFAFATDVRSQCWHFGLI